MAKNKRKDKPFTTRTIAEEGETWFLTYASMAFMVPHRRKKWRMWMRRTTTIYACLDAQASQLLGWELGDYDEHDKILTAYENAAKCFPAPKRVILDRARTHQPTEEYFSKGKPEIHWVMPGILGQARGLQLMLTAIVEKYAKWYESNFGELGITGIKSDVPVRKFPLIDELTKTFESWLFSNCKVFVPTWCHCQ